MARSHWSQDSPKTKGTIGPGTRHCSWRQRILSRLALAKASLEEAGIGFMVSDDEPRYIVGVPGAFGVGETPRIAPITVPWRKSSHRGTGTQAKMPGNDGGTGIGDGGAARTA